MRRVWKPSIVATLVYSLGVALSMPAQDRQSREMPGLLESKLARESAAALAKAAEADGDAARGALVFFRPELACTKCHSTGEADSPLGPDLTKIGADTKTEYIVESLLTPSKVIKKGYEPITALTRNGRIVTGLVVKEDGDTLVLKDSSGVVHKIAKREIESRAKSKTSLMPQGLVNQLRSRREFLDLVKFLLEIGRHGAVRAAELRPPESFFVQPLPEYEKNLDHAGLIREWSPESFKRGAAMYQRVCANCHGTLERPGSLPTSLRFARDKFKNGSDPYSMYQTLTHGFGMMAPQRWMVPREKYDVIHYIREAFLREHNPTQYFKVTPDYLAQLPKGTSRGPAPSSKAPWIAMNYGPKLMATYEIGSDGSNFAYKGIAIRLDPGSGGISQGRYWMILDQDTMRMAAAWSGEGFIDWNCILFNGRHAIHPRIVGAVHVANPTGPGWANPDRGDFEDTRLKGRDGRRYGPLPRSWAHYKGLYHYGNKVIVKYTVGETEVLEMPGLEATSPRPVFSRTLVVGPRKRDLTLKIGHRPKGVLQLRQIAGRTVATFGEASESKTGGDRQPWSFDGKTYLVVKPRNGIDMSSADYTVTARILTKTGGTIICETEDGPKWVPDGKTFFVRGGRLCFDIGWVGVVTSRSRVDDGKPHDVAVTWERKTGKVRLYIDGRLDGTGTLRPKRARQRFEIRIGFTAPDFPQPQSFFQGTIERIEFYQRRLSDAEIASGTAEDMGGPQAEWDFTDRRREVVPNRRGKRLAARVMRSSDTAPSGILVAGLRGDTQGLRWSALGDDLCLTIPRGKRRKLLVWFFRGVDSDIEPVATRMAETRGVVDLAALTHGGPRQWSETIETQAHIGDDSGPFAVDVLTRPAKNPWHCRVRLSGLDFFPDSDRAALCTWDGDVWLVTGVKNPAKGLRWQRIACGLFQPLGLKIVDGDVYVCCRDQIVILRDLNGDGETDFYENFNNDHQVTDHFHEFAMDLQTDAEGNFYYARGARHAKKALVPHHGTLLKVSKDGSKTEILATGFRAPNGVCVNPDGTFFMSDQEGHWIPKNRINWVVPGGFYGNMWGYHDVTDTSDQAMKQPVCWITNSFDRSPAEQLWVTSKRWGPLYGSLLSLSYGYGKIFVVPHERVGEQMQGGMCALPLPRFPTGVMRGRFHPENGQLYACGLFGWAGNQTQPGGFYRVRYTGKPVHLPIRLNALKKGMRITFSAKLDRQSATDVRNYGVKVWALRRSARYGSPHINERRLKIASVRLEPDGKTVFLEIPDISPTWCMEIRYVLRGNGGERINGVIHNTIHRLQSHPPENDTD